MVSLIQWPTNLSRFYHHQRKRTHAKDDISFSYIYLLDYHTKWACIILDVRLQRSNDDPSRLGYRVACAKNHDSKLPPSKLYHPRVRLSLPSVANFSPIRSYHVASHIEFHFLLHCYYGRASFTKTTTITTRAQDTMKCNPKCAPKIIPVPRINNVLPSPALICNDNLFKL